MVFDKVLCPWCGTEMYVRAAPLTVDYTVNPPRQSRWNAWMKCPNVKCGADGPVVVEQESESKAKKNARVAALHRCRPPLTINENFEDGRTMIIETCPVCGKYPKVRGAKGCAIVMCRSLAGMHLSVMAAHKWESEIQGLKHEALEEWNRRAVKMKAEKKGWIDNDC